MDWEDIFSDDTEDEFEAEISMFQKIEENEKNQQKKAEKVQRDEKQTNRVKEECFPYVKQELETFVGPDVVELINNYFNSPVLDLASSLGGYEKEEGFKWYQEFHQSVLKGLPDRMTPFVSLIYQYMGSAVKSMFFFSKIFLLLLDSFLLFFFFFWNLQDVLTTATYSMGQFENISTIEAAITSFRAGIALYNFSQQSKGNKGKDNTSKNNESKLLSKQSIVQILLGETDQVLVDRFYFGEPFGMYHENELLNPLLFGLLLSCFFWIARRCFIMKPSVENSNKIVEELKYLNSLDYFKRDYYAPLKSLKDCIFDTLKHACDSTDDLFNSVWKLSKGFVSVVTETTETTDIVDELFSKLEEKVKEWYENQTFSAMDLFVSPLRPKYFTTLDQRIAQKNKYNANDLASSEEKFATLCDPFLLLSNGRVAAFERILTLYPDFPLASLSIATSLETIYVNTRPQGQHYSREKEFYTHFAPHWKVLKHKSVKERARLKRFEFIQQMMQFQYNQDCKCEPVLNFRYITIELGHLNSFSIIVLDKFSYVSDPLLLYSTRKFNSWAISLKTLKLKLQPIVDSLSRITNLRIVVRSETSKDDDNVPLLCVNFSEQERLIMNAKYVLIQLCHRELARVRTVLKNYETVDAFFSEKKEWYDYQSFWKSLLTLQLDQNVFLPSCYLLQQITLFEDFFNETLSSTTETNNKAQTSLKKDEFISLLAKLASKTISWDNNTNLYLKGSSNWKETYSIPVEWWDWHFNTRMLISAALIRFDIEFCREFLVCNQKIVEFEERYATNVQKNGYHGKQKTDTFITACKTEDNEKKIFSSDILLLMGFHDPTKCMDLMKKQVVDCNYKMALHESKNGNTNLACNYLQKIPFTFLPAKLLHARLRFDLNDAEEAKQIFFDLAKQFPEKTKDFTTLFHLHEARLQFQSASKTICDALSENPEFNSNFCFIQNDDGDEKKKQTPQAVLAILSNHNIGFSSSFSSSSFSFSSSSSSFSSSSSSSFSSPKKHKRNETEEDAKDEPVHKKIKTSEI
jgi:hypothetical protein